MRIENVSLIISAFVCASLGVAALMRNFRNRLGLAFASLSGLFLAHDGLRFLARFDTGSRALYTILTLVLAPVSFWLLQEIMQVRRPALRRLSIFYLTLAGVAAVFFTFDGVPNFFEWMEKGAELALLPAAFIWLRELLRREKTEPFSRERVRFRSCVWGLLTVSALYLTDALCFSGLVPNLPPIGTLARSFLLLFIFQVFIQKEVISLEELASKAALFGGISVMLSLIFYLLVSWVGDRPGLFFFNTFIASFVIIVLFDPIRSMISKLMRRVFVKRNLQWESEFEILGRELRGLVSMSDIERTLKASLVKTFGVTSAELYTLERDELSYVQVTPVRGQFREVAAANPLVEYMSLRRGRPFVTETIDNDLDSFHSTHGRKFCQDCREALRALGANLIVPFVLDSKVMGFMVAVQSEKVVLSNEQLRLLLPVSRQVAWLLKNAGAFSTLKDRDKLVAIGEMAAGLAHEIKNPLGAIRGAAELLNDSGEGREFVQIIQAEADRLTKVLEQFLDYARPRRSERPMAFDPLKVIDHVARLALRDSTVKLEVISESHAPQAFGDPENLKQVILNLFLNAVQAMEKTSEAKITVVLREIHPRQQWFLPGRLPWFKAWEGWQTSGEASLRPRLEIQVKDNGPGISENDLSRVFLPFFTTRAKGTGLGLAICQRIIESMGGTIQVRANIPRGAVFVIHLPLEGELSEVPEREAGMGAWGLPVGGNA